ncbi:cation diffusion facilitator family transporter [Sphingomonas xanthus]|uniref:Cation transporter n=1 Tax=Sphingomonas xanthus TaxID=2594473 RepID=A0A516IST1_9SPHN|nr:cation diffusion facilitator family transporter [Sphingomonas xanthus]QDP19894.1 cation transporter [Sphingomonas xanthus]
MGAGHDHGPHAQTDGNFGRAFAIGIGLNLIFVAVEAFYGFTADSMALLADAGHNLSDVLGLIIAWIGATLVRRRPTPRLSYGLKKSSILAALINALLLLLAVGAIGAEAIRRLASPEPADGDVMMVVAGIGILVNGATALLFMRGAHHDLNIRGAFLHMVADAAVSAAVVGAGFLITLTGKVWIDPVASLIVAAVILYGTWNLLAESALMTLAGVPRGIDADQVGKALNRLPGVSGTHHLHIWSLSTTETALTVHLMVEPEVDRDLILRQAHAYVHELFGIGHSTIQVERAGTTSHADCPAHEGHCEDHGG